MCLFGVEANFQQRLVPRRVQKTPNAAVSPDWPQILSSAVNNYSLRRKTNSAACHLSLGLKPPAGSSRGAPALLFLFVVVMVGVCPCQSRPLVQLPASPPSDSALTDGYTCSSQILPSDSGLRSAAPRRGRAGILLCSAEINYIVSQQAEGLPVSGCK